MRLSRLLVSMLFVAPLAACGGGGESGDGMIRVDAATTQDGAPVDTPPQSVCLADADLGGLNLGTMQMRSSGDFFIQPMMGPLAGRTIFLLAAGLPGGTATATDVLAVEVVKPAQGNFQTNTAIPFETNGASTTYAAASYLLADYNTTANPPTWNQFYYASSGSVTLTAISEQNGGSITGTVDATTFVETDEMTGMAVAGGCQSSLQGLQFFLTQQAMAFDSPAKNLTPRQAAALRAIESFRQVQQQ